MKHGNWVPVSKGISRLFPRDRAFTEIEALVSIQLDHDNGKEVSVSGLAKLWGWNRKKVHRFLRDINAEIEYPQNTQKIQNQRGLIRVQKPPSNWADKGHMRLIDSRDLRENQDRYGSDMSEDRGRHGGATNKTDTLKTKDVPLISAVISYLNTHTGHSFKATNKATQRFISARLKEGYSLEDFKAVIDNRTALWSSNDEMREFLRPSTLFGSKFEGYLQAEKASTLPSQTKEPDWVD